MQCKICRQELADNCFLPIPAQNDRYHECVFCLCEQYRQLGQFLAGAAQSAAPDRYLGEVSGQVPRTVWSLTCLQQRLSSIEELKRELFTLCLHPLQQDRTQDLMRLELACGCDDACVGRGVAFELELNGPWLLQLLQPHTCQAEARQLTADLLETAEFQRVVTLLQSWLTPERQQAIAALPTAYRQVSQIYKRLQSELHECEDAAVQTVWGLPCRWRRGRGETNCWPEAEDLQRLAGLVRSHAWGTAVAAYVATGFQVAPESSYFQQRGYFLLLCCAESAHIRRILEQRIVIMVYAAKLLADKLFLLCRQRLNLTVLRNHIWMVMLLLQALRALGGKGPFPIMGITDPKDSELPISAMAKDRSLLVGLQDSLL